MMDKTNNIRVYMKELSRHAATAKAIRKDLKKAFPSIVFKVRSESFSGGSSVDVTWVDGPTEKAVGKIIYKYQYGHFDGMIDLYEITNSRDDIPQVKYVQWKREFSESLIKSKFEEIKKLNWGFEVLKSLDESALWFLEKWGVWTARNYIWRELQHKDFTMNLQPWTKEDLAKYDY